MQMDSYVTQEGVTIQGIKVMDVLQRNSAVNPIEPIKKPKIKIVEDSDLLRYEKYRAAKDGLIRKHYHFQPVLIELFVSISPMLEGKKFTRTHYELCFRLLRHLDELVSQQQRSSAYQDFLEYIKQEAEFHRKPIATGKIIFGCVALILGVALVVGSIVAAVMTAGAATPLSLLLAQLGIQCSAAAVAGISAGLTAVGGGFAAAGAVTLFHVHREKSPMVQALHDFASRLIAVPKSLTY